ncbi:MAG TPA: hypothetical protein VGX23_27165 [Actinocrinis sp.]|nr:hypothetical protein [Actinocrinis sp.]
MFFGNIAKVRSGIVDLIEAADPKPRVVVVNLTATFGMTLPSRDTLNDLREELAGQGVELWFAHLRARQQEGRVPPEFEGQWRVFPDVDQAVHAFQDEPGASVR